MNSVLQLTERLILAVPTLFYDRKRLVGKKVLYQHGPLNETVRRTRDSQTTLTVPLVALETKPTTK